MDVPTRTLAGVTLAVLALTAGCLGFVKGEEPLIYYAEDAPVPEDERGEFELVNESEIEKTRYVKIRNGTRTVIIETYVGRYAKYEQINGEQTQVASFVAISTPTVSFLGRQMNPIANMTKADIIDFLREQVEEDVGEVSNLRKTDTIEKEILDTETEVGVFTGVTTVEGRSVQVNLYVAKVQHGDDFVLLIGGHTALHPEERDAILRMMEHVEHDED